VRVVARRVVDTYRYRFVRVVGTAAVVFGTVAVVDVVVNQVASEGRAALLTVAVMVGGAVANAIGTTFYPGLLDRIVGETELGHAPEPLGRVLRTIPYHRLVVADILVVLATVVGLLFVVVPGLVVYTLFALTGPVINIEERGPISGMRRSAQLVRHHFWLVLAFVVVPLQLEHFVVHEVSHELIGEAIVLIFLLHAVTGMVVGSFVGVVVVSVAYALLHEERTT